MFQLVLAIKTSRKLERRKQIDLAELEKHVCSDELQRETFSITGSRNILYGLSLNACVNKAFVLSWRFLRVVAP